MFKISTWIIVHWPCQIQTTKSVYKEGYSYETALLKILNDLLWSMEHKKVSVLTFLDLSVAFDTVDHGILLEILEKKFGIRATALKCFTPTSDQDFSKFASEMCIQMKIS